MGRFGCLLSLSGRSFLSAQSRLGTGEPALGLTNCNVTFYLSGLLLLIRYKVCEDGEADSVRYQLSEPTPTHGGERNECVS